MKNAVILVFSPSGHTLKAGEIIKASCKKHEINCKLINTTKRDDLLFSENSQENLNSELGNYDLVFVGAPIYAGHFEGNMQKIINKLPEPDSKHANLAVPFVTYGGAHSSVALEEAGKLLKKKGYKSVAGLKVAATHTLSYNFTNKILPNVPGQSEVEFIQDSVNIINKILLRDKQEIKDSYKTFKYTPLMQRLMFRVFSQEKIHTKFKTVDIIESNCINCKKCVQVCPVNNFHAVDGKTTKIDPDNNCILCGECYFHCPKNAILFDYEQMAKKRLNDGDIVLEKELNDIYTMN